ncbi:uncharacterized protein LOC127007956 isoform X2 [Eriocheir sinensis]|uniref:uncharacterized protein LOC127007956 isoform X2 n=1 Tax=Eriocheir sinensis TaxID=95602 RepID=UPI0021C60F43|nr:uncharacterized protein LOC127007956 isoform X2 [Eriocheir sinensis]
MEEAVSSQWALVIRNDGEASVVPLAEVSALQQDEAAIGDKNQTIIVLQTQDQDSLVDESGLSEPGSLEGISGRIVAAKEGAKHVADFITVSAGREEGTVDPLNITIADAPHDLPDIGPDSLDNIHISVLAQGEVSHTLPHKAVGDASAPVPCEGQILDQTTTITTVAAPESPGPSLAECETAPPALTPAMGDSRKSTRLWKQREGKEKHRNLGAKFCIGQDLSKKQRREEFHSKVDRWTQKLSSPSNILEPFERLEATLHRDLTAELGLTSGRDVFINLQQHGAARGVRVTETSPGHIAVSGSLVELLASRDVIMEEIRKLRGLPEEALSPSTREVGVMCELIPSPATTRHASTLGLDRSARRYHSVLSRPLSPEPSPLRRRTKKQLLAHSKTRAADKRHLLKGFSERVAKKRSQSQSLKGVEYAIKTKSQKDVISRHICPSSQEEDSHIIKTVVGVNTEASGAQTLPEGGQSHSETRNGEESENSGNKSNSKALVSNKENNSGSSDGTAAVLGDGEGTDLAGKLDHAGLDKDSNCLSVKSEPHSISKVRDVVESNEEEMTKDESVFGTDLAAPRDTEGLEDTQNSTLAKFKFSCKICSYKSMRENHFLKHMQLHDKGPALYRCSECSFVSIRASHLRRHKMSHAQQVLHCHLCAYTCDDQKLLDKHVRVKHHTPKQPSQSDDMFECAECEYKTSWHYAFQRHRRTHASSKVVVIHTCPQCHYKTVRREHFLRHIKNVHQNYRPFLCDICGKAFKRQDALKQHNVSHYQNLPSSNSGQVGPYGFVCHICQKVCRSAAYLKEHMATHSEERSFLCEVCGASFKTRSVQRNHVQTIHRRPRAFTCTSCDKKFNTKFALSRHMKQHDNNLHDMEELPGLDRTPRISTSVGRLCDQPAAEHQLLPQADTSMVQLSSRRRSPQQPPSAYQITIQGQPTFLLPHLDGRHTVLEAGQACITEGDEAALVGGEGGGGEELAVLGEARAGAAVSVPVGPATVHILNQDSLATSSGDLILSSEQYDGGQASTVVAGDTANYINSGHGNSTLLYLTANFN